MPEQLPLISECQEKTALFRAQVPLLTATLALLALFPIAATAREDPKSKIQNLQPDPLAAVEQFIEEKRWELNVPGVAVAIVQKDRVIFARGFGLRDVEQRLPVTPNTLFAIGSCTKAFTAVTVLMSAEEGKLALTDSPKKYLPYFKLRDPEADGKITIGDLLCHRSGLDRTDLAWYMGRLCPEEVIRVAGLARPTAKLGEKLQYQNVMYLVAGEIVGRVQKKPWGKVVAERIFRLLGMNSSNVSVRDMQRASDYALGYVYRAATKQMTNLPIKDLGNIAPAGAINSNVKEMAQWIRLMLNGGVFEGKRLLSEKSFKELWVERGKLMGTMGYGYGWMLSEWNGHRVVEHGGGIDGFTANVALMPDKKLGVVVLSNASGTPLPGVITKAVWERLVGSPQKPAESTPTLAAYTPSADPAGEAGTYHLSAVKMDLVIAFKNGKLTITPTGQPEMALENVGGRRYKIGPPAPPDVFVTFRPAQDNPKETELLLEQSGMKFIGKKAATFAAPLSVDELMQKVIEAAGGETNLRKHKTLVVKFDADLENQGLTGEVVIKMRAPNAYEKSVTLRALGRKLATIRDYFDGAQGGDEPSFSIAMPKAGNALADAAIAGDFSPELNWKKLFKSVTIKGMDKIDAEEVYVVEKTPEKGSTITDYISTKSFLTLRRGGPGPVTTTFRDYRAVDGVMMPFTLIQDIPGQGKTLLKAKEITFGVRIPPATFRPRERRPVQRPDWWYL